VAFSSCKVLRKCVNWHRTYYGDGHTKLDVDNLGCDVKLTSRII